MPKRLRVDPYFFAPMSDTTYPVGNYVYFFVENNVDRHLNYSAGVKGGPGTPWIDMQNNGPFCSAIAAGGAQKYVYLLMKDINGNLYLNNQLVGGTWSGWLPMNFKTRFFHIL